MRRRKDRRMTRISDVKRMVKNRRLNWAEIKAKVLSCREKIGIVDTRILENMDWLVE